MTEDMLTLIQVVPSELWAKDADGIRKYHHLVLAEKLIEHLAEHGPLIVGKIEELAVISSTLLGQGQTEVRYRIVVDRIGPLVGEFYFQDGPADGKRIRTDGSPHWRIFVSGEPVSVMDYVADGPTASRGPLVAMYVRRSDYYRFEGYER